MNTHLDQLFIRGACLGLNLGYESILAGGGERGWREADRRGHVLPRKHVSVVQEVQSKGIWTKLMTTFYVLNILNSVKLKYSSTTYNKSLMLRLR